MLNKHIFIVSLLLLIILYSCNSCNNWLENDFAVEKIDETIEKIELHHKHHDSQYVYVKYKDGKVKLFNFYGTQFDFLYYIRQGDLIY